MGFFKRLFGLEPMADDNTSAPQNTIKTTDEPQENTISDEIIVAITAAINEYENKYIPETFNFTPIKRTGEKLTNFGKERIYQNMR